MQRTADTTPKDIEKLLDALNPDLPFRILIEHKDKIEQIQKNGYKRIAYWLGKTIGDYVYSGNPLEAEPFFEQLRICNEYLDNNTIAQDIYYFELDIESAKSKV